MNPSGVAPQTHNNTRAFLLLSLLALFAFLLWPGQAQATDHPFGHCAGPRAASCTLTVAANQTIFIKESFGGSAALPTDTFSLTYTNVRCDSWTDAGGTETACSYYAHTGANSGSDTVSFNVSTGGNEFVVESWDVADVVNTGSPVDQSCFATGSVPMGTSNVSVCPIQSTQTNDIFEYQFRGTDFFNSSFGLPANGPTVTKYIGPDTFSAFYVNATLGASPITVIPSGAPSTTTLSMSMSNGTGGAASFGGQLVTLKSGVSASPVRHRAQVINFKPRSQPNSVPRSTPRLLYAILRRSYRQNAAIHEAKT
jgi:hypothetical protein